MARRRARDGETVLITGASGGIGLELAKRFAAGGFDLVLVARRERELEALARQCHRQYGVVAKALPADLLAENAATDLVARLQDDGVRIDVLVNNAGVLDAGRFSAIALENHQRVLQLNIVVLTTLTHLLVGPMIARGRGRILNVGSTSAFQPVPTLALYAASKAFVLSLSESLSEELKGTGVTVTALCPGFTRTDMLENAQDDHAIVERLPGFMVSDVEDVAREGYEACLDGDALVVPGLPNRLGASLVQYYPRWLVRSVGGLVGRRST